MIATAYFDEVTTGTSTKTLVQLLAPTGRGIWVLQFGISFKGIDNLGVPIRVELVKQTTAGTAGALTPTKLTRNDSNTIATTAQQGFSGAEPTTTDVHVGELIHPQGGWEHPFIWEEMEVPGGERVGLRTITPAAAVNCVGWIRFRE